MRSLTVCSAGPILPNNRLPVPHPGPIDFSTQARPLPPEQPIHIPPHTTQPRLPSPTIDQHLFFDIRTHTPLLSPQARSNVTRAIQSSLAKSTIKRYSGAVRQFIRFCDSERVPAHMRFPADEAFLCAFAASSLGRHARSTPRSRLSALKAWHIAHNMEWKGSSRLRYVLNGVHNQAPGSSSRPPRPPVNARMLLQLIGALDLNSPLDSAVAACAATAFWGQCRLGELLPVSPSLPFPIPLPTRSDFKRSLRNPKSCLLHLPRTKTHYHGQDVVLVDQHEPLNPILLLKNHLHINGVPFDSHIFTINSTVGLSSLTKHIFLQRCNTIWNTFGHPYVTGHCFRIGGTTELLIAGTPPDVVKATGRWSSDSFLRYWRSLDDIAPHYIRNLHCSRLRRRYRRLTAR